jgi:hypothetical protein
VEMEPASTMEMSVVSSDATDQSGSARRKRQRGTIPFPYVDLNEAMSVTQTVWDISGDRATFDHLAARMGHGTVRSGSFRSKVNAARLFGLVSVAGMDVSLTDLGRRAVDHRQGQGARIEAFLAVPLFKRIYERYRGGPLPPTPALEQFMVDLGVAPNQRDRARQVFLRSAEQAGFFAEGRDRLVKPATVSAVATTPYTSDQGEAEEESQAPSLVEPTGGDALRQHPLIEGLIRMLPPEGPWPRERQEQWLEAARVNLALLYGSETSEAQRKNAADPDTAPHPSAD